MVINTSAVSKCELEHIVNDKPDKSILQRIKGPLQLAAKSSEKVEPMYRQAKDSCSNRIGTEINSLQHASQATKPRKERALYGSQPILVYWIIWGTYCGLSVVVCGIKFVPLVLSLCRWSSTRCHHHCRMRPKALPKPSFPLRPR